MLDALLKEKLKTASSFEEVKEIIKDYPGLDAERIWQEVEKHNSGKSEKLDLEELDVISGGFDRDWTKDGCAATCEYNSWCGSNDFCYCFDVTYDNFFKTCPDGHAHVYEHGVCVRCGYYRQDGHPGLPR